MVFEKPGNWDIRNLQEIIAHGAPAQNFLWPISLTYEYDDSLGYLMALRPSGYFELGDFFIGKAAFKTYDSMLLAAINICDAFDKLRREGFCFKDINEGGFFLNPDTGDVLICDCDNVTSNNTDSGFHGGKPRYMAPEVIQGKMPNNDSGLFSLAIVLYRLFMIDHPYEGKITAGYPCMTDEINKDVYGAKAVFTFDAKDSSNRPVPNIQRNASERWGWIPPILQQAFQEALGKDQLTNPRQRMQVSKWKQLFLRLRRELAACGDHDFILDSMVKINKCPFCNTAIKETFVLEFTNKKDEPYLLTRGKKVYLGEERKPVAQVVARTVEGKLILGLRNLSQNTWKVTTPSGKMKDLPPTEVMPLIQGTNIRFAQGNQATVKFQS